MLDHLELGNSLLINERIRGAITFGFGKKWEHCASHVDMVCLDASIDLDGMSIMKQGVLNSPKAQTK